MMHPNEVRDWGDYFEVDQVDLPDLMMRFYCDATELRLIMDRLGHAILLCPNDDLRKKWAAISRAMTGLVLDIGILRREMLRRLAQ